MAFGCLPQNTLGFVAPFLPNFAAIFYSSTWTTGDQSRRTLTFSSGTCNCERFHLFFEYGRGRSPHVRSRHQVREHWIQFHWFAFQFLLFMLSSFKVYARWKSFELSIRRDDSGLNLNLPRSFFLLKVDPLIFVYVCLRLKAVSLLIC